MIALWILVVAYMFWGLAHVCEEFLVPSLNVLCERCRIPDDVAGATLMPSTLSLIRNVFVHPGDRRIAIATWAAMFSGGAALGPVLGGYLLGHFWAHIKRIGYCPKRGRSANRSKSSNTGANH